MKQRQIIFCDGLLSNATVTRWERLLLVTLLLVSLIGLPVQAATVYKFSPTGVLPIGCSLNLFSTTSYTCGVVTLAVGDTITVGAFTPVTVTFTGAFTTAAGNLINTVGAASDLNLITNGVLTLGANSTLNANVIGTAAINVGVGSTIGGNITASTTTGVVTLGLNSTVGGFIQTDAGAVNVGSSSTIGGGIATQAGVVTLLTNIKVGGDISTVAGAITIGNGGSTCNSVFSTGAGIVTIATNVQVGNNVSTIDGAITISGGSKIGGDVSPTGAGVVTLTGVHVGGKVVTSAGAITLTNSRVGGSVVATGAGVVTLTNSVINDTSLVVPVPPGCSIQLVSLVSDHHFDENIWSGIAEDVLDSSGNGYHGEASKWMTNSTDGVVCNAADFSEAGTSDYVSLKGSSLNDLDDFSISIWGKLDSSRSGQQTIFSGASNSHQNGVLMFFSNTSTLNFYLRNKRVARYPLTDAINDGEWHHYVWTRNEGEHCLFMDGVSKGCKSSSYTGKTSVASNGLIIGQEQDSVGGGFDTNQDWEGLVDEPMIFSGELSPAKVLSIYSNQAAGKNYDGTSRICPAAVTPIAEYRFEEGTWNGSQDEILDNTTNGHHAQVNNNSTPETAFPALSGNPGTCGYASQNDGSIQVTGLPLDKSTIGVKTTVTFWMNWDGTNNVMPIGWNLHDIWMVGGSIGFNTWNNDIYGISSAGLANGWHHIAVEFTNGNVTQNRIHIDGVEQTLTQRFSSPNNGRAFVNSQLRIGGVSNSQLYDFHGLLDEVRVYESALSTGQVASIMAERHDCNEPVIHHYEISHDGQGLTCEAETLIIKACTNESCSSLSTESVTLDVLADGTAISSPTFTGTTTVSSPISSTVNFNHTVVETLTFSIANATIAASNNFVCNDGSSASCDMAFTDAGFRFLYGNSTTILNPILNQTSGTAFGDILKLQAVKDIDGVCTGLFTNDIEVDLSQENVAPGGTSGLNFTINGSPIAKHSSVTSTTLNFGANSIATIPTPIYHDAGKIRLHANYDVGGVTLTGSSNSFWVSPAVLAVSAKSGETHLNAASATATPIHKAGVGFNLTVTALNSLGVITPNYSPGQIQFKLERTGPILINKSVDGYLKYAATSPLATSTSPIFQNVTLTNFSSGVSIYNTAQYSEVGLLNLDVQDSNYGNANIVIRATAINIGRFTPDHFKQTVVLNGDFYATCDTRVSFTAYSGQKDEATSTIGAISYLTKPILAITAYNKQHEITQNYYEDSQGSDNDYMKLSNTDVTVIAPTLDQDAEGVDKNKLSLTANIHTGTDIDTGTLSQNDLGVLHYQLSDKDNFFYNRSANALVTPFTSTINISTATIQDSENVDLLPTTPIVGSPTTVDVLPTGIEIRFGRLRLENSFGPETSNLPQPMQLEHFDGTGFVVSSDNNCVSYDASKIVPTKISLEPSFTEILGGTGIFFNGKTRVIELKAPGARNQGKIDVLYDTYDWLKYDWDNNDSYDNPSATATFGLFRGNDRIIYQREVYR